LPSKGLIAITGPSGSGKSTLLNCLSLLEKPTEGEIDYLDERIDSFSGPKKEDYRNFECGFVYQHFNLLEEKTAFENVAMPLELRGESEKEVALAVHVLFRTFHLSDLEKKKARLLSGGEKQRVAILRALVGKPRVLFADEPTGALDAENERLVMETLKQISRECLVVLVSHNERLVKAYADREITLEAGHLVKDNPGKFPAEPPRIEHKRGGNKHWLFHLLNEDYRLDGLKNLLSFLTCFLCFLSLIATFGFYVGSHQEIETEKRASLQYLEASISKTVTYPIAGSPLKLSQSSRPSEEEIAEGLGAIEGVEVAPDFSYFFPRYSAYAINGIPKDPVSFVPLADLSLSTRRTSFLKEGEAPNGISLDYVLVNEEFAALCPEDPLDHLLSVSNTVSVQEGEANDEVSLSFSFRVLGIVHEFSFLNSPKVYYSYPALRYEMGEIALPTISKARGSAINCAAFVEEADGHSPYASYDYLLLANDEIAADKLKSKAKALSAEASPLSITSSAFSLEDAFLNLSNAFSLGLVPFLGIEIAGVGFILGSLAYSSFLERKKEAAILMSLGARKQDLRSLYLGGSFFTAIAGVLAALSLALPLEKYGSVLLEKAVGVSHLISIPLGSYFGVPFFLIIALFAFAILISALGAGLPLLKAEKSNIAEELRDE
jgi:putative ABC transport system ATP-binding protein